MTHAIGAAASGLALAISLYSMWLSRKTTRLRRARERRRTER